MQRFFDFLFGEDEGWVMGHGKDLYPHPSSPKYDNNSWDADS
ncbi:MAG: hypothetical protein MHPDNHAH_01852 [Anaerolineales bacterium]|nr:hypothetical protein [Anaerolineales bacterium]